MVKVPGALHEFENWVITFHTIVTLGRTELRLVSCEDHIVAEDLVLFLRHAPGRDTVNLDLHAAKSRVDFEQQFLLLAGNQVVRTGNSPDHRASAARWKGRAHAGCLSPGSNTE